MKEMVKMIGKLEVQKDTFQPESIISIPARVSELDVEDSSIISLSPIYMQSIPNLYSN